MANLMIPSVSETYHSFLKRLVGNSDVQRGVHFLEMPLCHRRVVFLDAFRNAYHDMARKCASAQAESMASQAVSTRTASAAAASEGLCQDRRPRQKAGSASTATSEESKPTKSRLQLAILEARETTTPVAPKTAASSSETRLPAVVEKTPSRAPEAEKDSKDVLLLDSPSFFEEEKSVAPPVETSQAA
jgi:hypothetical protein